MSLITSFSKLYDLASRPTFAGMQTENGFFVINEQDAKSSPVPMTQLRVEQNGVIFTAFNFRLVKGMKDITSTRSSMLKDHDCDGIVFASDNTHDSIILAELKSRFSSRHLAEAFEQMVHSYLKLHAMLSMCKGYSIDTVSVHFIAACQCFEDANQRDGVYNFLGKAEVVPNTSFEGKFLRRLIEKHTIDVTLGDVTDLWGMPLNEALANRKLTMSLQVTNNYGDDHVKCII
ncbi:hypothetical protein SAMN06298214_0470 [Bacteroidales bacterium WCE2004]|nr:hypothetical protein SAMN06298214_0470 [Bacteroidales bacterium WCE2004]